MAETARRFRETGGSDIVRRLIARPIRLDPPRIPARTAAASPFAERLEHDFADANPDHTVVAFDGGEDDVVEADDAFETEVGDVVDRLQAEMALMKAVLMAERAESAALRARLARLPGPEPVGAEARATRDRWAAMVDRLLISAR